MRRPNRHGAQAYVTCTACDVRRQIPWHLRLEPSHRPDVYVCKYCKPRKIRVGAHGEMDPEYRRDWHLQKRYGITAAEYDDRLSAQGGVCAVCQRPPGKNRLAVDHDHDSGRVRGILCVTCNSRIEWFETHHDVVSSYLDLEISPSK